MNSENSSQRTGALVDSNPREPSASVRLSESLPSDGKRILKPKFMSGNPAIHSDKYVLRFWSRVNKNGPKKEGVHYFGIGNCWLWTGGRYSEGYGIFWNGRNNYGAHVFSFLVSGGTLGYGEIVTHRCDEKLCCRPSHLRAGTYLTNAKEAAERGLMLCGDRNPSRVDPSRLARGDKNGARLHPDRLARGIRNGAFTKPEMRRRGEAHGMSVITEQMVLAMRARNALGGITFSEIGRKFSVSKHIARRVILRITWNHVQQ